MNELEKMTLQKNPSPRHTNNMNARKRVVAAKYFCLLLLAGCGGQLYKVAPLPAPSQLTVGEMGIGAAVLDGDRSLERFEANLPMAGVLPVEVSLVGQANEAPRLADWQFEVRDAAGQVCRRLAPEKALRRVMKFYGNNFYPIAARKRTEEDYRAIALGASGDSTGEMRGMLFFEIPPQAPLSTGFSLTVKKGGQSATLPLSIGNK